MNDRERNSNEGRMNIYARRRVKGRNNLIAL